MEKFELLREVDPFVRMVRLKRSSAMSGKWKDIDHVFTYIASGSADFIVEGVKHTLHAGDAIIIPPYKTHIIVSHEKELLVQYIIHFDFYEDEERKKLLHKDVLEEEYMPPVPERESKICEDVWISEIPEAERNDLVRRYLSLFREFKEKRPGRDIMIKADCMGFLVTVFRNRKEEGRQNGESVRKSKSWIHIENAVEYINKNGVIDDPDNEQVARAIGVTPNYLTKVFQEYLGMSLHKYVMNLKVEKAQQLLLGGKVNITEAARMAGFSSIHVLSKTFKNILGISPSEFLDQSVNRETFAENIVENLELTDQIRKDEKHVD